MKKRRRMDIRNGRGRGQRCGGRVEERGKERGMELFACVRDVCEKKRQT